MASALMLLNCLSLARSNAFRQVMRQKDSLVFPFLLLVHTLIPPSDWRRFSKLVTFDVICNSILFPSLSLVMKNESQFIFYSNVRTDTNIQAAKSQLNIAM